MPTLRRSVRLCAVALISLVLLEPRVEAQFPEPACRPCAGVRTSDPDTLIATLGEGSPLEDEDRLYVSWQVDLDGSADSSLFTRIAEVGAIPWVLAVFRSPQPILENLPALETELRELARLAANSGERGHIQIDWRPEGASSIEASQYAFVLKRAGVTVTGANPEARFMAGPLRPDIASLRALYAEEVAAYLDGVALAEEADEETLAVLMGLDPGKPVVLDSLEWPAEPARVLSQSAEAARQGYAVTMFRAPQTGAPDLRPLSLLAREFRGDLSYDPYTIPSGAASAWTFVKGEDLSLRVIAEPEPGQEKLELFFPDPTLRSPVPLSLEDGTEGYLFGLSRSEGGLKVPIEEPGPVVLLRVERMSAEELEGIAERVQVADERQMPVEEILRRLQALEDDQARKLDHWEATNTLHLRFLVGAGAGSVEATYAGPIFFQRDEGFDWAWESFFVDGVRWRGKKIPEVPLIQPEKAAALPVEIYLSKEYLYRLRGSAEVEGRDCWVIDFEPAEIIEGRSLYQGTVWVDKEIYARVRTRAVQLGLSGDVISNEETTSYAPLDANGQPAPWDRSSFIMPVRITGQQILSVLNASVPVEKESVVTDIRINRSEFEANREVARASDSTMVRDTEEGLRYLVKTTDGERVVQQKPDTTRLFVVGGIFYDETQDYPIPLAGVNYLALDFKETGNQLNFFFAGPVMDLAYADPSFLGSRWDLGANLFGFFLNGTDELYRDGIESPREEVETRGSSATFFLGRPLGQFAKLDFTYGLSYRVFRDGDNTDPDFVLPEDTLTHRLQTELSYNRSGYRLRLQGSLHSRDDWGFWGLPGNTEFDESQKEYSRWSLHLAKTFWFQKFRKLGLEYEHLDGSDLDRFSRYDFGIFGDSTVAGYPSGLVRADEADGLHINYGINAGELFRFEIEGDAVWATAEDVGLDQELLAGVGLEGTVALPWQLLINFELGKAVSGPADGWAARIVFLRLFPERHRAQEK